MGIFLSLSNVALFDAFLCEPFGENVIHPLWRKGDEEGVIGLVLGHGGDVDVFGEGEGGERRGVNTEELGDFADAIGTIVEEEESVIICGRIMSDMLCLGVDVE